MKNLILISLISFFCSVISVPSAEFTLSEAQIQAAYASAAYCPEADLKTWTCDHCTNSTKGMKVTKYMIGAYSVAGYVGYNDDSKQIIIAFRGSANLQNWIADLYFIKADFPYPNVPGAYVHSGFFDVWKSFKDDVKAELAVLQKLHPDYQVVSTGHSLGGAIATFCALHLEEFLVVPSPLLKLWTFGEPRVGEINFANYFSGVMSQSSRCVHANDIVPHLPPRILSFHHTPREVWQKSFNNESDYVVCDGSGEDPNCSDSLTFPLGVEAHGIYFGQEMGGCRDGSLTDLHSAI